MRKMKWVKLMESMDKVIEQRKAALTAIQEKRNASRAKNSTPKK